MEISKEDFMKKFAEPLIENMKQNMSPDMAARCTASVKVMGKSGKAVDFKAIMIEFDIPDM